MFPFSKLTFICFSSLVGVLAADGIQSAYIAPGAFPTSVYKSYWNDPTATSAQPQPVISDPVTNTIFPANLTDPANFPKNDTVDPHLLPSPLQPSQLLQQALSQIKSITSNPALFNDTCGRCQASLAIAKMLVLAAPEQGPPLVQALCVYFNYSTSCYDLFSNLALGSIFTQVIALGDMGGYDGQLICSRLSLCPVPPTIPLNMTGWFAKPKPNPLPPPKQPSGKRLKVLHISDIHIDPRMLLLLIPPFPSYIFCRPGYATGYEANCTAYLCCRENVWNADSPSQNSDIPISLMLAAMQAIPTLTGTNGTGFNLSVFTGDLTAHDPDNQYSRAFVEQAQVVVYDLLKKYVGPAPVYATLGNHDTYMQHQMIPYYTGGVLGQQFNWLYEHVSALWYHERWIPEASVEFARTHYAAYSVKRPDGLRIISLDTNILNYFSYVNATEPDPFGILRFLTDELQDAEDAGERAWIIGHVNSGWDGTQSQLNPTNLCKFTHLFISVDRYSPHVIASKCFSIVLPNSDVQIFYANNATVMSAETAYTVSWIAPSLTPLTNLNSGFRMYEIDSAVSHEYPSLDNQTEVGPTYFLEYSTRETYGGNITWGTNDPLNATWWHLVTEPMDANPFLLQTFNKYQSKSSVQAAPCTSSECLAAKICYMRSGSASIAHHNCKQGYGSTQ
ncbi:Metallo-dependent phosphatase-like protein [Scleroderma yunnanense]